MGTKITTAAGQGRSGCKLSRRAAVLGSAALLLASATTNAQAQVTRPPPVPVTQFDMTGLLQDAKLTGADVLAGGTLTVNGHLVIVPRNVIVLFPAAFLTWEQVFQMAPPPYGPTQTGLAMSDVPAPFTLYEVHVTGNRVAVPGKPDQYIAGLVSISQQSLNSGQGYINFIDYSVGEMRVGGIIGDPTTGARIRINDPTGRFNGGATLGTPLPTRLSPDPRFALDSDNPTIRSETGYPMCLPSSAGGDALCPLKNRPFDALTGTFASQIPGCDPSKGITTNCMAAVNPPGAASPTCPGSVQPGVGQGDPCLMAPFEIGDWVTYAGTLVNDGPQPSALPGPTLTTVTTPTPAITINNSYISAWNITANVGIWTAPKTDPAYVATDVTLLGTGGVSALGAAEAAIRTRFEGFTTDAFRFASTSLECQDPAFKKAVGRDCSIIDVYGIDFDPCTGVPVPSTASTFDAAAGITLGRPWGGIDVDQGPPTGVKTGRWRFRPPSRMIPLPGASGVFDPPPQQMRAHLRGAKVMLTSNGLFAGQYAAPITEYIFPENGVTGTPIVPNNFESFPFLVNGLGPLSPGGPIIGQLSPWPGAVAPTASKTCAATNPTNPIASAGANQTLTALLNTPTLVTLDASGSTDPNGLPLTFAWTQTAGTPVTLSNAAAMFPTFTVPTLQPGATAFTATFSLVVSDATPLSSTNLAQVTITVNPPAAAGTALPPNAVVGPAQNVASGQLVLLSGALSNDPNTPPLLPLTFLWTASAPVFPGGVTTSTLANPTFTAPIGPATLTFTLVVTNAPTTTNPAGLASAPASVTVTVAAPVAPVALIGDPTPGAPPAASVSITVVAGLGGSVAVPLDGSFSFDPNGLPLTYSWVQVSGPGTTVPASVVSTSALFTPALAAGNYGFTLTVSDGIPGNVSVPALATVSVFNNADIVAINTAEYRIAKQRLTVTASATLPGGAASPSQLYLIDPSATPPANPSTFCTATPVPPSCIPLTLQNGALTAILVGVPEPTTVTVVSSLGGVATTTITRLR